MKDFGNYGRPGEYEPWEPIALCFACKNELTRKDDEDGLVVWIKDSDYLTTGISLAYCRGCAEDGVGG